MNELKLIIYRVALLLNSGFNPAQLIEHYDGFSISREEMIGVNELRSWKGVGKEYLESQFK